MTTLLIIDQNRKVTDILGHNLRPLGYSVLVSNSAQGGYLKALHYRPHVILMDLQGAARHESLRACLMLRRYRLTRDTPIIAKAAFQGRDQIAEALSCGVTHCLAMPIQFDALVGKLAEALRSKGLAVPTRGQDATEPRTLAPQELEHLLLDPTRGPGEKLPALCAYVRKCLVFPHTLIMVLRMEADERAGARELSRCISADTAMCTALLRLANSIYYAKRMTTVVDIQEAIVRIGFRVVKSLVVGMEVMSLFRPRADQLGFRRLDFWLHSITAAACAAYVAVKAGYRDVSEAYVAGLLHDLGKLILDEYLGGLFDRILERSAETGEPLFAAERQALGFSHEKLAASLLEGWGLPARLARAIEHHHDTDRIGTALRGEERQLAQILYLSNLLAKALGVGCGGELVVQRVPAECWAELGLAAGPLEFQNLLRQVTREVKSFCLFFGLGEDAFQSPGQTGDRPEGAILECLPEPCPGERVQRSHISSSVPGLFLRHLGYHVRTIVGAGALPSENLALYDAVLAYLDDASALPSLLAVCKGPAWAEGLAADGAPQTWLQRYLQGEAKRPLIIISPAREVVDDIEALMEQGLSWEAMDLRALEAGLIRAIHGTSRRAPERGRIPLDDDRLQAIEAELSRLRRKAP